MYTLEGSFSATPSYFLSQQFEGVQIPQSHQWERAMPLIEKKKNIRTQFNKVFFLKLQISTILYFLVINRQSFKQKNNLIFLLEIEELVKEVCFL